MTVSPKKASMVPVLLLCLALFILLLGAGWAVLRRTAPAGPADNGTVLPPTTTLTAESIKDATFVIDGQAVTLVAGNATVKTDIADATVTETYVLDAARTAVGDLNADGKNDVASIVHYGSSGTGIFSYVVALLTDPSGIVPLASEAIGDRVLIEQVAVDGGSIVVEYLDRDPDEAMATVPHVPFVQRYRLVQGDRSPVLQAGLRQSACAGQNLAVQAPAPQSVVAFPLTVTAVVDNTQNTNCIWTVFEAQAGIATVVNQQNNVIASAALMTVGDWMTTAPVTYTAVLQPGVLPPNGPLTLIITEEDPSGMQIQEQVMVPITY